MVSKAKSALFPARDDHVPGDGRNTDAAGDPPGYTWTDDVPQTVGWSAFWSLPWRFYVTLWFGWSMQWAWLDAVDAWGLGAFLSLRCRSPGVGEVLAGAVYRAWPPTRFRIVGLVVIIVAMRRRQFRLALFSGVQRRTQWARDRSAEGGCAPPPARRPRWCTRRRGRSRRVMRSASRPRCWRSPWLSCRAFRRDRWGLGDRGWRADRARGRVRKGGAQRAQPD